MRVSYFDPRTGEPCEEKPKPLRKERPRRTFAEIDAERDAALREGAEIEARMAARKGKKRDPGRAKKPVVVDGVRYESLSEASRATGISTTTLRRLSDGGAVESAGVKRPRPVVVDGVRFESVAEAARRIGTKGTWLGKCLRQGKPCKGHEVRFAEGEAWTR